MNGAELITAERKAQTSVHGWTDEHDDQHQAGELANAAAYLAATRPGHPPSEIGAYLANKNRITGSGEAAARDMRVKHLVIAGALCAAEIDRLQRKQLVVQR